VISPTGYRGDSRTAAEPAQSTGMPACASGRHLVTSASTYIYDGAELDRQLALSALVRFVDEWGQAQSWWRERARVYAIQGVSHAFSYRQKAGAKIVALCFEEL
jgi:hypothetical protein